MNFNALKWMIESIIQSYKCPECFNNVNDTNVDIIWAAWNTINIDVACSNCNKHSMIKSEVLSLDFKNISLIKDKISKLKLNWNISNNHNISKSIKDNEIINLNKKLNQKNLWVWDLFNDNN